MPVALQAVLLRLLDDWTVRPIGGVRSKVDVFLLSATNASLDKAIAEARFRSDLLYRLDTLDVTLPNSAIASTSTPSFAICLAPSIQIARSHRRPLLISPRVPGPATSANCAMCWHASPLPPPTASSTRSGWTPHSVRPLKRRLHHSTTSSGPESLRSMPKPLETSAKLHGVSVSQEILFIGHLDKKSRDDLRVRALPMLLLQNHNSSAPPPRAGPAVGS